MVLATREGDLLCSSMVAMSSSPSIMPIKPMRSSRHMEAQPPSSRASCQLSVPTFRCPPVSPLSLTHFRNAKRSAIQSATSGTVNNGRGRQWCGPDAEYPTTTSVRAERCPCHVDHTDRSDRGGHDGYRLKPSCVTHHIATNKASSSRLSRSRSSIKLASRFQPRLLSSVLGRLHTHTQRILVHPRTSGRLIGNQDPSFLVRLYPRLRSHR